MSDTPVKEDVLETIRTSIDELLDAPAPEVDESFLRKVDTLIQLRFSEHAELEKRAKILELEGIIDTLDRLNAPKEDIDLSKPPID